MGFSTLVRICNLRYFFALRIVAKVTAVVEIDFSSQKGPRFSFGKAGP